MNIKNVFDKINLSNYLDFADREKKAMIRYIIEQWKRVKNKGGEMLEFGTRQPHLDPLQPLEPQRD